MNPQIIVGMIMCPAGALHRVAMDPYFEVGSQYCYGICMHCDKTVFSDLAAEPGFAKSAEMSKFLDEGGHLWVAEPEMIVIEEEPF